MNFVSPSNGGLLRPIFHSDIAYCMFQCNPGLASRAELWHWEGPYKWIKIFIFTRLSWVFHIQYESQIGMNWDGLCLCIESTCHIWFCSKGHTDRSGACNQQLARKNLLKSLAWPWRTDPNKYPSVSVMVHDRLDWFNGFYDTFSIRGLSSRASTDKRVLKMSSDSCMFIARSFKAWWSWCSSLRVCSFMI